ncbi:TM0106 family RecB-like putative nuclease [Sphingomonas sp. BAUL-RG-20F-R05-02]|uniref:TM0106 family RecB-like putative nuclease n=1 Tax=Sphingomonas sp. BAUL-RG-20F-R05-02 TaxID=2914830 RepID=UPI001F577FD8|nr:TM0106 family RecB-like putative nuclease [Sphingomonas sp. BAUL-RG-20F-R05-02]
MRRLPNHITATMVRDLSICEHRFHLDLAGDHAKRDAVGVFVQMLWAGGMRHEKEILSTIEGPVADLRDVDLDEREEETSRAVAAMAPVILGGRITHADQLGMPDVMRLDPSRGYIAGDVKSGAADEPGGPTGRRCKKDYGVQISHYGKILAQKRWGPSGSAFIIDHDGEEVEYDLMTAIDNRGTTIDGLHTKLLSRARLIRNGCIETSPAASAACAQCHWRSSCRRELEERKDPTLLPQVGRSLRHALGPTLASVPQIAAMRMSNYSTTNGSCVLKGIGIERLARIRDRAILLTEPDAKPFARRALDLPVHAHEIHYDVESDPLQGGVVYLHGFHEVVRGPAGVETRYTAFFAYDIKDEGTAFENALNFLAARPDAHIYIWSRFERTSMRQLQSRYPAVCGTEEIEDLFREERCTDLYTDVVLKHTEWPLHSYGLKKIARYCGFEWRDEDPSGANSIAWFSSWLETGDRAIRDRIIQYNEDDVIATARVLEALRLLEVRQ